MILLLSVFLILSLAIVSCDSAEDTADLDITLEKEVSRTITPTSMDLSISQYVITLTGPNNSTTTLNTKRSSVRLEGLEVGTYNIQAKGCNAESTPLVQGSTTFDLNPGNTSATVVLSELIGSGALNITYNWDSSLISSPSLKLRVVGQDSSYDSSFTPTISSASASLTITDLASGSYVIYHELYNSGVKAAGGAESVRIVNGKTTNGTITLNLDAAEPVIGELTIDNKAGVPVTLSIEGITSESQVSAQEKLNLSLNTGSLDASDLSIAWILDGTEIGTGTTVSFTPMIGQHRVDVIASTKALGSTGSASVQFEAALLGQEGVPVLASIINDSEDLKIGGRNRMAFLNDGAVAITSDAYKTITIASIVRNSLTKQTSMDYPDATGTIVDIEAMNGVNNVVILDDTNDVSVRYNYNSSSKTLSDAISSPLNLTNYASSTPLTDPVAIVRNGSWIDGYSIAGHMVSSISGTSVNYLVCRSLTSTITTIETKGSVFLSSRGTIVGKYCKGIALVDSLKSGNDIASFDPTGGVVAYNKNISGTLEQAATSVDDTVGGTAIAVIPIDNVECGRAVVANGDKFVYLSGNVYSDAYGHEQTVTRTEGTGLRTNKMIVSDDGKYLYALNSGNDSISTYEIDSNGMLNFLEKTDLSFSPENGLLSNDGKYFFVWGASSSSISLFRIKR